MLCCDRIEGMVFFTFGSKTISVFSSTAKQATAEEGNITRYLYTFTKKVVMFFVKLYTKYNVFLYNEGL